jgi:predicted dehydrogenase
MKLRGAISGFGDVAAHAHLAGWRTRNNLSIGAIHDPVAERRHEAIRLIKNVRVYDDFELMLDGERLDFVDIASPPALHGAAARMALNAGAHVLVEKPLCLSLADFDELAELARTRERVLMCVHNWKYAPAYALAHALVDEGRIGEVRSVSFDRLRISPAGTGRAGGTWRSSSASGGGILIDHGWHVFYLMQWLMGGETPQWVSAILTTNSDGVEEVARLEMSFWSGRSASANLSWRANQRKTSAFVTADGNLEVGTESVVLTDTKGQRLVLPVHDIADDSYHSSWFSGMAAEFENAIAEGAESALARSNLTEARNALAIIVAARDSAKNRGAEAAIAS